MPLTIARTSASFAARLPFIFQLPAMSLFFVMSVSAEPAGHGVHVSSR